MRGRVGSCLEKIAQYGNVRELEVKASGKCCGLPRRDAETGEGIRKQKERRSLGKKGLQENACWGERDQDEALEYNAASCDHCIWSLYLTAGVFPTVLAAGLFWVFSVLCFICLVFFGCCYFFPPPFFFLLNTDKFLALPCDCVRELENGNIENSVTKRKLRKVQEKIHKVLNNLRILEHSDW